MNTALLLIIAVVLGYCADKLRHIEQALKNKK